MAVMRPFLIVLMAWFLVSCAPLGIPAAPVDSPTVPTVSTPDIALLTRLSSDLFLEPDKGSHASLIPEPMIVRSRLVNVNSAVLDKMITPQPSPVPDGSKQVSFNLFPDAQLIAMADRVELSPHGFVWLGHTDGTDKSRITIIVEDNVLSGNIRLPNKLYQVRFAGNNLYSINELDPKAFPN